MMEGPPYHHADWRFQLDPAEVLSPVRALLGDPSAHVVAVSCEPVVYDSWSRASDGLYLVRGTAVAGDAERSWRMILKQFRYRRWTPSRADLARQIDDGGDGAGDWAYWRREALALASPELTAAVSPEFRAPRCLEVNELDDSRLRLWQEYVCGTPGTEWKPADLLAAAEQVGAFHARSLDPDHGGPAWFCRPFLEQAAVRELFALIDRVAGIRAEKDHGADDLVQQADISALEALRDMHGPVVQRLRKIPPVLLHRDLTPRILFRTLEGTVAIDWGQTGSGPAGEDLATLVLTSAVAEGLDPAQVAELGRAALQRHSIGAAQGPRYLDPAETALSYRLVAAYHFGLPLVRMLERLLRLSSDERSGAMQDPATRRRIAMRSSLLAEALPELQNLHG